VNCPEKTPTKLVRVGKKLARSERDIADQWSLVASALSPIPRATAIARIRTVDRTVSSFVHSERSSP
jgi:hypothetical protein